MAREHPRPDPPAANRTVLVPPERLARWLAGFAERHGEPAADVGPETVVLRARDGAVAVCTVPFPPLPAGGTDGLVAHVVRDRRVGVLLVRLGGFAVGIFAGARLDTSKVGARHVQGRTAAGGWSQQRFARRRAGQAKVAYAAAADAAARLLLPEVGTLDAVVVGGDRVALAAVLADNRLAPLRTLVTGTPLPTPDPRRSVLEATPATFRAVRIRVSDPAPPAPGARSAR